MRYFIIALFLGLISLSCDDGDVTITNFNFDTTASIQSCSNVLYKIKNNELLYLNLPAGTLKNEKTPTDKPIVLPVNTTNVVAYRLYNINLSSNSFCTTVAPANLIVTGEWIALEGVDGKSGLIQITTTESLDITTGLIAGYKHEIRLINVMFTNGVNQFVFNNYLVGTYTTTL